MMKKDLFLLVMIFAIYIFPINKIVSTNELFILAISRLDQGAPSQSNGNSIFVDKNQPEVDAAKNKDTASQYASNTIVINEPPNPPRPNNTGFFLRIIRPCPNIDYKIRVFNSIPDLDPGINLSGPNKNLVIPGASGQTCERIFPKSDVIQSNQVGIEQVLDQEGMSPTPVITKTNKIRILEIPHTCDNSQLFYLSLPAKCLVSGHLITKQQTPNKNMIKITPTIQFVPIATAIP
jgi:hypothetical protein